MLSVEKMVKAMKAGKWAKKPKVKSKVVKIGPKLATKLLQTKPVP